MKKKTKDTSHAKAADKAVELSIVFCATVFASIWVGIILLILGLLWRIIFPE